MNDKKKCAHEWREPQLLVVGGLTLYALIVSLMNVWHVDDRRNYYFIYRSSTTCPNCVAM